MPKAKPQLRRAIDLLQRGDSMTAQTAQPAFRSWTTRRDEKRRRMQRVQPWMNGPVLPSERIVDAFEAVIVSGDSIVLEGDNQKQADFLSRSLVKVNPGKLHDLHLIISSGRGTRRILPWNRWGTVAEFERAPGTWEIEWLILLRFSAPLKEEESDRPC
jgi:hypothetical protein